jgi:formylglycine-generating enzyme required for sulfatase activity
MRKIGAPLGAAFISWCAAALPVSAEPLDHFKDCETCPEMVVLPAGKYLMGATKADRKLSQYVQDELPQHEVTIAYRFAIGKFELTVDEFAAYVAETGATPGGECGITTPHRGRDREKYIGTEKPGKRITPSYIEILDGTFRRPGAEVTGRHPATCISRREAAAYLEWLSKKTGKHYRFPTESEWEYAARAGSTTPFFFGDRPADLCRYANFADRASPYFQSATAKCSEKPSPDRTAQVGSYQPNPWGLHDMVGNVSEFVEDCASNDYNGAPADGSPRGRGSGCANFVLRGYGFTELDMLMRSAARCLASNWDGRANLLGARVALSLDDAAWDRKK